MIEQESFGCFISGKSCSAAAAAAAAVGLLLVDYREWRGLAGERLAPH